MLLAQDVSMGTSDTPGQPQKCSESDVTEKYQKLKKRYSQLEEKHNELLDELQWASERNVKMREERNILLDRIIELEAGNKLPPGTAPQATQSAFPRTLVRQRTQTAFIANIEKAEAELAMEIDGFDIRESSKHLPAIAEAHRRAEDDRRLALDEALEREARREAKKKARAIEYNGKRPRDGWYPQESTEYPPTQREDWVAHGHYKSEYDHPLPGTRETSRRFSMPGFGEMNGDRTRKGWNSYDADPHLDKFGPDTRSKGRSQDVAAYGASFHDHGGIRRGMERYPPENGGHARVPREMPPINGHSRSWADPAHTAMRTSPAPSVPGPDVAPHMDPPSNKSVAPRSTTPPDSPRYSTAHRRNSRGSLPYPNHIPQHVAPGGHAATPVAYAPMIHYEPPVASSSKPRQPAPTTVFDEPKGPKQKRARTQTAVSKPIPIPVIPRDANLRPILPLAVGMLTLISLGEVCTKDSFHTERYIYPVGYEITKRYQSTIDPRSEVLYHCSIHDGGEAPTFQIIPADRPDKPVTATTATGAWSSIVKQANAIRNRNHSNSVSGPEFFGLGQNTIRHLIQELPGALSLRDYARQIFVEGGQMGTSHDPNRLGPAVPKTREIKPAPSSDQSLAVPPSITSSNRLSHSSSFQHPGFAPTSPRSNPHTPPSWRSNSNTLPPPLQIQQYQPTGNPSRTDSPTEETHPLTKPLTFVAPLQPS